MTGGMTGSSAAAMFQADRPAALARAVSSQQLPENVQAAREAVDQFVGETFYALLLKESYKTVSQDHFLSGGDGEATMRPYLNQVLAQRMAQSRHFDLADAMFDRIYRDTPYSSVKSTGPAATQGKEKS